MHCYLVLGKRVSGDCKFILFINDVVARTRKELQNKTEEVRKPVGK